MAFKRDLLLQLLADINRALGVAEGIHAVVEGPTCKNAMQELCDSLDACACTAQSLFTKEDGDGGK